MASRNKKTRYAVVGGIVVIVLIAAAAFLSAGTVATSMSVAEAAADAATGKKVEVTGNVVDDSYKIAGDTLDFSIYDPDNPSATLPVRYDRGVSATFGNGVTAICTGTLEGGVLRCTQLVTKCPSKYETASNALSVSQLLGYGESIVSKNVKVAGTLAAGTLKSVNESPRLVLEGTEADGGGQLPVRYTGALSDQIVEGAALVVTGALQQDGSFEATQVALEGTGN